MPIYKGGEATSWPAPRVVSAKPGLAPGTISLVLERVAIWTDWGTGTLPATGRRYAMPRSYFVKISGGIPDATHTSTPFWASQIRRFQAALLARATADINAISVGLTDSERGVVSGRISMTLTGLVPGRTYKLDIGTSQGADFVAVDQHLNKPNQFQTWADSYGDTTVGLRSVQYVTAKKLDTDITLPTIVDLAVAERAATSITADWSSYDASPGGPLGRFAGLGVAQSIRYYLRVTGPGGSDQIIAWTGDKSTLTVTPRTILQRVTGLQPNTNYILNVAAGHPSFTQSAWSPSVFTSTLALRGPPVPTGWTVADGEFLAEPDGTIVPVIAPKWPPQPSADWVDVRIAPTGTSNWITPWYRGFLNPPTVQLGAPANVGFMTIQDRRPGIVQYHKAGGAPQGTPPQEPSGIYDHNSIFVTTGLLRLVKGGSYDVQIRAVNNAGRSAWTASKTVVMVGDTTNVPATPTNLQVTGTTETTITLSWTAVSGGRYYNLRFREEPAGATTFGNWDTSSPRGTNIFTQTLTGLLADRRYAIQLQAGNDSTAVGPTGAVGRSGWSASVYATTDEWDDTPVIPPVTPTVTPPAAPYLIVDTDPTAGSGVISDSEIHLAWLIDDGTTAGRDIDPPDATYVEWRWREQGTTDYTYSGTLTYDQGAYTINFYLGGTNQDTSFDLKAGTTYEVSGRCVYRGLKGPWGVHSAVAALGDPVPSGGAESTLLAEVTASTLPLEAVPPAMPAPTLVASTPQTALVSWAALTASPAVTGFQIFNRDGPKYSVVPAAADATSVTVIALLPDTEYEFRIRALNEIGAGPLSPPAMITMPPPIRPPIADLPTAPPPPTLTVNTPISILVEWEAVVLPPPRTDVGFDTSIIDSYTIHYREARAIEPDPSYTYDQTLIYTSVSVDGKTTGRIITGLLQGTEYVVHVRATNTVGDGPFSDGSTATTHTAGAPIPQVVLPPAPSPAQVANIPTTGSDLDVTVWIEHPVDGYTLVSHQFSSITVDRGVDPDGRETIGGKAKLVSETEQPWVGPWEALPGVWTSKDLITALLVILIRVNFDKWEPIYTGYITDVTYSHEYGTARAEIDCLDMWGARIAQQFIDVPPVEAGTTTDARLGEIVERLGFHPSLAQGSRAFRTLQPVAYSYRHQRAAKVIQELAASENGYIFVDRAGTLSLVGGLPAPPAPSLIVNDNIDDAAAATPTIPPMVEWSRGRLVNAPIIIAADGTRYVRPYSTEWGTSNAGSVIDDSGYLTPWEAESGEGRGASGATEVVRADFVSIGRHGKIERRVQTGLSPDDARILADDMRKDLSDLQPTIPDVSLALHHEAPDVAQEALRQDLDTSISISFVDPTTGAVFGDVLPVESIKLTITPLDQDRGTVAVSGLYTLHEHSARVWWTLPDPSASPAVAGSVLGESTFLAPGVPGGGRSTSTPDGWIPGELVDEGELAGIAQQVVVDYINASDAAADTDATAAQPLWSRFLHSTTAADHSLRQYDTADERWRTLLEFR